MRMSRSAVILFAMVGAMGAHSVEGATCTVPSGSHSTIQVAVDDPACTELVLAAQVYSESVVIGRTLTLQGAGSGATTIEGQVEVSVGVVDLVGLMVDASTVALAGLHSIATIVHNEGQMRGSDLVVRNGTVLFADGFEIGSASAWSAITP